MSTPTSPPDDADATTSTRTTENQSSASESEDTEEFSIGDAIGPQAEDTLSESDDGTRYKVGVPDTIDPDAFFTTATGAQTLATQEDLERILPNSDKPHLEEISRYWVNKPYAYVVIFNNRRLNEDWYIPVQPQLSDTLQELRSFIAPKLRSEIDFGNVDPTLTAHGRAELIQNETVQLLKRYQLIDRRTLSQEESLSERIQEIVSSFLEARKDQAAEGDERVDPIPVERDDEGKMKKLTQRQLRQLLYYLVRDIIRYSRIDPLKHDVNVEDIHCVGYDQPIFVNHSKFGLMVTTIRFPNQELDSFVNNLAEDAGKGISKRNPDVDATLSDGSRAQLTLKGEISGHGTNFTIRQFREVPFTPVDLINWETYSLDQIVYLWLAIEHKKSMIIAGGTASGKTTSLNALTLFMPANSKFVSIEDTRELELPQRAWLASKTRPGFNDDDAAEIDEFDLLENGLRQRPDYVIMGEVRGEEGRTLFQVMSTGHTTYTTFHADDFQKLVNRFTGDPINVPKAMFSSLDLISVQKQVHLEGQRLRRNTEIVELDEWNAAEQKWDGGTPFEWDPKSDSHVEKDESSLLDQIRVENGWDTQDLHRELWSRRIVLAYLVKEGLNSYPAVAATLQAFMRQPEDVLTLIAEDRLGEHLENLRSGGLIDIDIDEETEALVPRPSPTTEVMKSVTQILDETDDYLETYQGRTTSFSEELISTATDTPMTNEQLEPDTGDDRPERQALEGADDASETPAAERGQAATQTPRRTPEPQTEQELKTIPDGTTPAENDEAAASTPSASPEQESKPPSEPPGDTTSPDTESATTEPTDQPEPSGDTSSSDTEASPGSPSTPHEKTPDPEDADQPTESDVDEAPPDEPETTPPESEDHDPSTAESEDAQDAVIDEAEDTSPEATDSSAEETPLLFGKEGVPGRGISTDQLNGIGNAYRMRLEDAGIHDIEDLTSISVESVAEDIDAPVKQVSSWVAQANTWEGLDE